jgi:hypothetical protein
MPRKKNNTPIPRITLDEVQMVRGFSAELLQLTDEFNAANKRLRIAMMVAKGKTGLPHRKLAKILKHIELEQRHDIKHQ